MDRASTGGRYLERNSRSKIIKAFFFDFPARVDYT